MIYGKVRKRQGNSATDWTSTGVTSFDYTSTNTWIECGSIAAGASPQTITFPTAFNQKPLVIACTVALTANCFCTVSAVTASQFNVQVVTDAGVGNTAQAVNWIAIGQ